MASIRIVFVLLHKQWTNIGACYWQAGLKKGTHFSFTCCTSTLSIHLLTYRYTLIYCHNRGAVTAAQCFDLYCRVAFSFRSWIGMERAIYKCDEYRVFDRHCRGYSRYLLFNNSVSTDYRSMFAIVHFADKITIVKTSHCM